VDRSQRDRREIDPWKGSRLDVRSKKDGLYKMLSANKDDNLLC